MIGLRRRVMVRLDREVVEITGGRSGRPRLERHQVPESEDAFAVLGRAIRSSPLLRPGGACEVGVLVESSRTLYRSLPSDGVAGHGRPGLDVVLPDSVTTPLEAAIARRRVHGPAWFAAGPIERAVRRIGTRHGLDPQGCGVIIDRSFAAVTVLVVSGANLIWARGAPADAPADAPAGAAAILLARAASRVGGSGGFDWWHLEDLTLSDDAPGRLRAVRELEAWCRTALGGTPRIPVGS